MAALTTAHRYGAEIGELAEALRLGDADRAIAALRAGGEAVEWVADGDPAGTIRSAVLPHALAVHDAAAAGDAPRALAALDGTACCARTATGRSAYATGTGASSSGSPPSRRVRSRRQRYVGRPILVASNDYSLGVYNGDTGVVVASHGRRAPRSPPESASSSSPRPPRRRGDHARDDDPQVPGQPGRRVTVLLPDEDSRLLTRELFYTAVTRAQERLRVIGSEAAVRAAIASRPCARAGCAAAGWAAWLKRPRHRPG